MGAPTSEVGCTSAITRRGGPQSLYGHVVVLEKNKIKNYYSMKKKELIVSAC
jgi:hypothetical protein